MKISIEQQVAFSETGSRFLNEDRFYPSPTDIVDEIPQVPGLYMVADGSGGQEKGDIAAKLAIREFAKYIKAFPPVNSQITYGYLSAALLRVEEAFHQYVSHHPESEGMATTVALMYADEKGVAIGWIGNSRVIHVRGRDILFQTRDQMVIQDLVAHGRLSPEEAESQKGNFTQARMIKGTSEPTDLDFHFIPGEELEEGDVFLLATDGITREVTDSELQNLLGGPLDLVDLKEELVTLCKSESSDNHTAILVELGEVAEGAKEIFLTDSPPLMTNVEAEGGPELDLDNLEEVPNQVKQHDYNDPVASSAKTGEQDTKSEKENNETSKDGLSAATILDRIQSGEKIAEERDEGSEAEEEDDKRSRESSGAEGRPRPDIAPEPRPGFLQRYGVPLLLGALIIAAAGYAISQMGGNKKQARFEAYLEKSHSSTEADSIIFYARQAHALAASDREKNAARALLDKGLKALNSEVELLQEKANVHVSKAKEGGYADLWQAQKYLGDALAKLDQYPEQLNPGLQKALNEEIYDLQLRIDSIPETTRINQLIEKASQLCKEGRGEEAEEFYAHAGELIGDNETQLKNLASSRESCNPPAVADRSLKPADTDLKAKGEQMAEPADTRSLPAASDANTRKQGSAEASEIPTRETVASRNARPSKTQLSYLEKGIALFEKQRLSNSNYEASKAAEYLEKASSARTGAASYMLAVLYNQGKGVDQDMGKALRYAKESALKGYPGGHYMYASILLKNENPVDSVTAKKSLNVAASKGHPEATNLLYQLTQPAARLRRP